jgi:hypothetical protein
MTVVPMLRIAAAGIFLLVIVLANPSGADGVIATAGVYGLIDMTLAAAGPRAATPKRADVALMSLALLAVGVGILPLLLPPTAALVVAIALVFWLCAISIAMIRSGQRTRQVAASIGLLLSLAALVSIAVAPAVELHLLALGACACAAASWQVATSSNSAENTR